MPQRKVLRRVRWLALIVAGAATCRPTTNREAVDVASLGLPLVRAGHQEARDKLSPYLHRLTVTAGTADTVRVLVDLSVQLDLMKLGEVFKQEGATKAERRLRAVTALQQLADLSQAQLRPLLDRLVERGAIESYRGLAIVNRLVVTATPDALLTLAERDEVAEIIEETTRDAMVLTVASLPTPGDPRTRSWAVDAVGAAPLWKDGAQGQGVLVGIIDTGASPAHEQLEGNFRGGEASWYDPAGKSSSPQDSRSGHGTTILSVAVGQNVAGKVLGVAPHAAWIACAGIPEGRYNNIAFAECADWMLRVGQPDVLINAWLLPAPGCDRSLERIVNAWRAAEILPVFSAGNDGPAPQSSRSPANYAGLYPGDGATLSVGGVTPPGSALITSSRGPGSCNGSTYPTVVAPAAEVLAAFPLTPATYKMAQGTSVAAGIVAGAAALLLQQHPEAAVGDLERAIASSAIDRGPAGPDNTFGQGLLSLPAARDSLDALLNARRPTTGETATTAAQPRAH